MTVNAEKFEELLTAQLKATLDPERGKALAAFRGFVAAQEAGGNSGENSNGPVGLASGAQADRSPYRPSFKKSRFARQISRREAWFWTAGPSLIAASLGIVLTLQALGRMHATTLDAPSGSQVAGTNPSAITNPGNTQITTFQQEWTDPQDGAHYRVTEPVENVQYQELKPF